MADLEQLKRGLVNADRAGDSVAAQRFADEIRARMKAPETMPAPDVAEPASVETPTAEAPSGLVRGLRDPIDAGAQMLTHLLPDSVVNAGNQLNNWIADKTGLVGKLPEGGVDAQIQQQEAEYQKQREAAGETGIDGDRLAGNVAASILPGMGAVKGAQALKLGRLSQSAMSGAATAMLNPVTDGGDSFIEDKAMQAAGGALAGGATQKLLGGVSRLVSPKASVNPDVQALRGEGVNLSIGQTLGGAANRVEQKLQSMPIIGDSIQRIRDGGREDFQKVLINKVVSPVGGKVDEIGHEGVTKAGDLLSAAYDDALKGLKGFRFDAKFGTDLKSLRQMAGGLTPDMARKFENIFANDVQSKLSPAQGMAAETFKIVDSKVGSMARKFAKSSVATEQELGDALFELQRIMRDQVVRISPQSADKLNAANQGWAMLTRLEKAAAKNAESGEFTPKQFLQAVREMDGSVRHRAVSRGDALMQDMAAKGSRVLSETVPNSGTVDRLLPFATGGAAYANPMLAAGALGGGYAAYLPIVQKLLTGAAAARPQGAQVVADQIAKSAPRLSAPGTVLGRALLNE